MPTNTTVTATATSASGSTGRTTDPIVTSVAALRIPPMTSPNPKAYWGEPRHTGEFSTTAELRLQVEPETENPATVPIAR